MCMDSSRFTIFCLDTGNCRANFTMSFIAIGFTLSLLFSAAGAVNPIAFESAPSPQYFLQYDSALIECRVTGSPAPEISWRFNGKRIVDDDKHILNSNGLTIQDITVADAGVYQCRAEISSSGAYDQRDIDVIVNDILDYRMSIEPPNPMLMKPLDSSVMLTCSVLFENGDDFVQPNIKWVNPMGEEINSEFGRVRIDEEVMVARLFIINLKQEDAGLWKCEVTIGNSGMVKNTNIILYKYITFEHAPPLQQFAQHGSALVECQVTGLPAPEISWKFNGHPVRTGGKYTMEAGGLRVNDISAEDSGSYQCIAKVSFMGTYDFRNISVIVT